jgi:hypothetical protein
MPLARDKVGGFKLGRMVVEFTMLNGKEEIECAVSTAAMDDRERNSDVKPHEREAQFMRLRDVIEESASRKFFAGKLEKDGTILVTSKDL